MSITTGEMKPRGMFVDENALSLGSIPHRYGPIHTRSSQKQSLNTSIVTCSNDWACICNRFSEPGLSCVLKEISEFDTFEYWQRKVESGFIAEIHLESFRRLLNDEISLFVFPATHGTLHDTIDIVLLFVAAIERYQVATKQIIILIVPTSTYKFDQKFSPEVEMWISSRYSQEQMGFKSMGFADGLIREALVIDLFGRPVEGNNLSKGVSDNLRSNFQQQWTGGLAVMSTGINGALPNMDIIAALGVVFRKPIEIGENKLGLNYDFSHYSSKTQGYLIRLCNLFEYVASIAQGSSGFHSQFLNKNIDSVTIRPGRAVYSADIDMGAKSISVSEFIGGLCLFIQSSHSLHGELMFLCKSNVCSDVVYNSR